MLILAGKIHDLHDLGLRDLVGIYAAFADTVIVDLKHDPGRGLPILLEKPFQDQDDEFHRRVVIIQQQDAVKARLLDLRLHG